LNQINLFVDLPGESRLEAVANVLADSLSMPRLSERESGHYLEGRYFRGRHQGLDIEVSLCDPVLSNLRYRLHITGNAADAGQKVDEIVRQKLMPSGFICQKAINFGRLDQQVMEYSKQT
jgi:hypothetical protein